MHIVGRNINSRPTSARINQEKYLEQDYEIVVNKFSNMLCKNLEDRVRTQSGRW